MSNKGELFVKEVIARLKGDNQEALASKISRKAIAAITSQISALESDKVDAESEIEVKEEELKKAIYPTEMITDNKWYCRSIVTAREAVDTAKQDLEDINHSIKYFKNLLTKF